MVVGHHVRLFESRSTTRTSNSRPSMFWNDEIRLPSRRSQRGRAWTTARGVEVACCGLRPRASVIQIRRGPAQEASKAIRSPSGEWWRLAVAFSRSGIPPPVAGSRRQMSRFRKPRSRPWARASAVIPAPDDNERAVQRPVRLNVVPGSPFVKGLSSPLPRSFTGPRTLADLPAERQPAPAVRRPRGNSSIASANVT